MPHMTGPESDRLETGNAKLETLRPTRRRFLRTAAAAGALAAGATRVRAAKDFGSRVLGANERLVMGIIGSGGMGRHHMHRFKAAGVEWGGVCDVYSENLAEGMKIA